jgi:NAD(P)-dependent dehydrogenase (short-subunit alcohol dehydrogenase family)
LSGAVVITGAARGIGAAMAGRMAAAGSPVLLVDVDATVVDTAAQLEGAAAVTADVTTEEGINSVASAVRALGGPLTGLINNAGITRDRLLHKMEAEAFAAVIRVNLSAPYHLSRTLTPLMSGGGAIVNVSSKSANGNVGQYNYAVSKAGLIGMTRAMALELAPHVRVNAIAPAFIQTAMTDAIPDAIRERLISQIPFGRPGDPEEVADAAAWLLSEQASYVTGQVVAICGGRSFGP